MGGAPEKLFDKTGREIVLGDLIKVFHFVGARRKRHYMYKHATYTVALGKAGSRYLFLSHLNLNPTDAGYHERLDGRMMRHWEIVQSADAQFEERPRLPKAPSNG